VTAVNFSIPLAMGDAASTDDDELHRTRFLPPGHSQILRVAEETHSLRVSIQSIDNKLKWLIGLVVALGLLALLFRH
jgi:hypothetical protein